MTSLINKKAGLSHILNAMISPEAAQVCHQLFCFPLLSWMHLLWSQLADAQILPVSPGNGFNLTSYKSYMNFNSFYIYFFFFFRLN